MTLAALALLTLLAMPVWGQQPPAPPEAPEPPEAPPPVAQADDAEAELEARSEALAQELDEVERRRQEAIEQALDEVGRELRRGRRQRRSGASDNKVSIGSTVRVEKDRIAENVVAIGAGIKIDGEVVGDAVAIMGSIKIDGRVTGDVVAVLGGVELGSEAEVLGDITSVGGHVDREEGSTVVGSVSEVAFSPDVGVDFGDWWPDVENRSYRRRGWGSPFRYFDIGSLVWFTMATVIFGMIACLVLLVAPNAVRRVEAQSTAEPWKAGLVGFGIQVLSLPVLFVVCLLLIISIVGLLVLPFLLLALIPIVCIALLLGFTGTALGLGRTVGKRFKLKEESPFLLLLLGTGVIASFFLFGDFLDVWGSFLWIFAVLFAMFGAFVWYVAFTVGLGSVFLTRFGTWSAVAVPPPFLPPGGEDASAAADEYDPLAPPEIPDPPDFPDADDEPDGPDSRSS